MIVTARREAFRGRAGFQVKRVRTPAAVKLSRLVSPAGLTGLLRDLDEHGAGVWRVARVKRLGASHPDRFCGSHEYTHVATIIYRPVRRRGLWECVYGVTAAGEVHLWCD